MSHSKQKSGFTLVELLVVIIIITVLAGLAIPAIMMGRERARRLTCANNLEQLSKGLQAYEISKKQYPGWINNVGGDSASWPVTILKHVDRSDVYDLWREGNANVEASKVHVGIFVCPSANLKGGYPLSYVANCGQQDDDFGAPMDTPPIPPDWPVNGVFFRHYCRTGNAFVSIKFASDDIIDGQQHTLLLSENLQAGNWANIKADGTRAPCDSGERLNGMIWWLEGVEASNATEFDDLKSYLKINANMDKERAEVIADDDTDYNYTRPSSYHPGGVNAVFCAGNSKFLSEQIDFKVYAQLMATDDKKVKYAGKDTLMKDPVDDKKGFLQGKIPEDDLK